MSRVRPVGLRAVAIGALLSAATLPAGVAAATGEKASRMKTERAIFALG